MPGGVAVGSKRFDVLLVNFSSWLGVARLPCLLNRAGCRVHVFARRGTYVVHSSYCHRTIYASDDLPAFMAELRQFIESEGPQFQWVIIADDEVLLELSRRLDEPWCAACLPVRPVRENMDLLLDKAAFPKIAGRHGLPVPRTRTVRQLDDALSVANECGYPLIAKSVNGCGGAHVACVRNKEELRREVARRGETFALQAFAGGTLCSGTVLFQHGKLRFWAVYERSKTHPAPYGPSAAIRFVEIPWMAQLLQKLGDVTGFHGLCGVDFMYRRDAGTITLLELNGRPTPQARVYLGEHHGGLENAIRAMLNDEPVPTGLPAASRTRGSVPLFPEDVSRSICERDYANLLRWGVTPLRWPDVPWREPLLLKQYYWMFVADVRRTRKGYGEN